MSSLLLVSDEERLEVRRSVNWKTDDDTARDVDMVVEWYEKQPHLPRVPLDRDFVERLLIYRKGSVEKTKQKIEKLYTCKTCIPDVSFPYDIRHVDLQRALLALKFAALPRLNSDLTRVHIYKLTENHEDFVLADTFKYTFLTVEYRLKYDYAAGDRYVYDLQNFTPSHVTKVNPMAIKNGEILVKAYGSRILGFHFINAPSLISVIISIAKSVMSEKLFERISIHDSVEDLHKFVSKSILPKEYGGDEKSLDELAHDWEREFDRDHIRQYLLHQESLKSDESLRTSSRPTDHMLGIPGSFKKLDVD